MRFRERSRNERTHFHHNNRGRKIHILKSWEYMPDKFLVNLPNMTKLEEWQEKMHESVISKNQWGDCGSGNMQKWENLLGSQHEGPEELQPVRPVAIHATQVFGEPPEHDEARRMTKEDGMKVI